MLINIEALYEGRETVYKGEGISSSVPELGNIIFPLFHAVASNLM